MAQPALGRRLATFAVLWIGGVAAMATLAYGLKLILRAL